MTDLLFRADAYRRSAEARIVDITEAGIVLDATVFYAQGGGQPGDVGLLRRGDAVVPVANTVYGPDKATVFHVPAADAPALAVGDVVTAELDWPRRYARMRVHTAMHLLSVALPYAVTGGAIGDGEGRLDFDCQETLDRERIAADLNALVARDAAVTESWITDEELDANPGLVKTMTVKPPRGSGRVRLVAIEGIDLQPCGGTHVARTSEIGPIEITGVEKKGRLNRRVRLRLAETGLAG